MFFRTCQSLRDPARLAANSRLSVQIAGRLPAILATMPPCMLSPGLVDDSADGSEDADNVCSVFYQLLRLFEELLGLGDEEKRDSSSSTSRERDCLSVSDRAVVIVAYVALSLKWGRLGYLLKGVKMLLEHAAELNSARFESLGTLLQELAAASIERPQIVFGEEDHQCGYLMSFGKGDHGKLGHGQCAHVSCQEGNCTENKMVPTMIVATRDIEFCKIDSLSTHSIAITANGEAMSWGNGDKYRLGHGSSSKEYIPRTIEFLRLKGRVRDLACGLGHTLALLESGEIFAWGNGSNGRLGLGDTNDRSSPTRVAIPTLASTQNAGEASESTGSSISSVKFRHIFCGASHSLGISWDGTAYAWGKNNQGQCGHGHTNDQWVIQRIESFGDSEDGEDEFVVDAAGGWEHTLFCTASGRVYSCGCGYKDSRRAGIPPVLGHGDCDRRLSPTLVQGLEEAHEEIIKVACGWDHSLAVSTSGRVYTWGSGTNGKLGHGDEESFDTPTLVRSMEGKKVKDAKAGCEHTVFLTYDHELWTCGQGDSGRLGHGDNQTRKRPTRVELLAECGLKPVALAVGDKYNLVLVTEGRYEHLNGELQAHTPLNNDIGSSHATAAVHHCRHRAVRHMKVSENQEAPFGAKWVLAIAENINSKGSSSKVIIPDSARAVAFFIAGHVDRLASDYIAAEYDMQCEKQNDYMGFDTLTKPETVLLPFAVDTSCESLRALIQLLRWTESPLSGKEKGGHYERSQMDGHIGTQDRMGLALSCLRVMQFNLRKLQGVTTSVVGAIDKNLVSNHATLSNTLLRLIHDLLDTLAGLHGEDVAYRFDNSTCHSAGIQGLSTVGSAVSQEAASALMV
ncbi:unnamed protein product [Phytophthora fragariaefolia]|uniref:Unnamed protein product n=1 Tax=Phytophthora fragariaefolia TaxID=1490495 RepID=A0A9W6TLN9_9STRA|nr:unnamed protein product [Phytophthora fragariaefolia]